MTHPPHQLLHKLSIQLHIQHPGPSHSLYHSRRWLLTHMHSRREGQSSSPPPQHLVSVNSSSSRHSLSAGLVGGGGSMLPLTVTPPRTCWLQRQPPLALPMGSHPAPVNMAHHGNQHLTAHQHLNISLLMQQHRLGISNPQRRRQAYRQMPSQCPGRVSRACMSLCPVSNLQVMLPLVTSSTVSSQGNRGQQRWLRNQQAGRPRPGSSRGWVPKVISRGQSWGCLSTM